MVVREDLADMILVAEILEVGCLMGQTWCPDCQASGLVGILASVGFEVWLDCWVWVGTILDC